MNDETVIALLKESVPHVPDVPSRYASVRALAGRQRSYARMQAIGAVASVVLVLAGLVAVTRSGGGEVRPVSDPVATMTAAFRREEWVSFETTTRYSAGSVSNETKAHGTKHRGDVVSFGGFFFGTGHDVETRSIGGTLYQSVDGVAASLVPPGVRWLRTPDPSRNDMVAGAVAGMTRDLRDVRRAGTGTERGVRVARYTARRVSEKGTVTVSFALDAQGRPRRIVADGPASMLSVGSYGADMHLDVAFFDYGVPRPFEAPPASEVIDMAALAISPATDGCTANRTPTQADADACADAEERAKANGATCKGRVEDRAITVECSDSRTYTFGPKP